MLFVAVLVVAVSGLCGMTWFFPVLAAFLWNLQRLWKTSSSAQTGSKKSSIPDSAAVVLPAYNEEPLLKATLESICAAVEAAHRSFPGISIRILVGADGCTDGTAQVARNLGAEVIESPKRCGKWNTLLALVKKAVNAEVVVCADAGVLWNVDFLTRVLPEFSSENVLAVAPAYFNPAAGRFEGLLWWLERRLKRIEGAAGGPVSIHGATVLYRREVLVEAFKRLDGRVWLNDDVVIPMCVRSLRPEGEIRYLSEVGVSEQTAARPVGLRHGREFGRRRRMVIGNLQWLSGLFPLLWRENKAAAVVACRRAFRLLWAYWVAAFALALGSLAARVPPQGSAAVVSVIILVLGLGMYVFSSRVRYFGDAAAASLLAPVWLLQSGGRGEALWK